MGSDNGLLRADVAAMQEEDDRFFRPDWPGQHEDDL